MDLWERNKQRRNLNVPVECQHLGQTLRGAIVVADGRALRVRMDEPFQDHDFVNFGYASAMAKHFQWEGDELTIHAHNAAERVLKKIYDDHVAQQGLKLS